MSIVQAVVYGIQSTAIMDCDLMSTEVNNNARGESSEIVIDIGRDQDVQPHFDDLMEQIHHLCVSEIVHDISASHLSPGAITDELSNTPILIETAEVEVTDRVSTLLDIADVCPEGSACTVPHTPGAHTFGTTEEYVQVDVEHVEGTRITIEPETNGGRPADAIDTSRSPLVDISHHSVITDVSEHTSKAEVSQFKNENEDTVYSDVKRPEEDESVDIIGNGRPANDGHESESPSYDFYDFGCSNGGSIKFARDKLGGIRGMGLDVDERKVNRTQSLGYDARVVDCTRLVGMTRVQFVTMLHFLEHLPSRRHAEQCVQSALSVSNKFVYIRHPWFDSDGYMLTKGMKLYWSDWKGHTYHMTTLELHTVLRSVQLKIGKTVYFVMAALHPILSSSDPSVLPLGAPTDSHSYDMEIHGFKKLLPLDVQACVHREVVCVATTNPDFDCAALIASVHHKQKYRILLQHAT